MGRVCATGDTAGKRVCPMPEISRLTVAVAASLLLAGLSNAALARGGGHGGSHGMAANSSVLLPKPGPAHRMPPGKPPSGPPTSVAPVDTSSTAPVTIPVTPPPPAALAAPAPSMPAIAPLSPPPPQNILSGGGSGRVDLYVSPTAGSTSPSEAAPSIPGGGGDTLADCMRFWDRGTHMTKVEWRAACTRTLRRLDLRMPLQ